MTTVKLQDVPFYYKNAYKYPYIDKISVGEDNHKTDFIYQFVKNKFYYQWDNRNYTSYFNNMIGPPCEYLNVDDYYQSFDEMAYASSLDEVDPKSIDYQFLKSVGEYDMNTNFINIEFHEAVYPIKVCMYVINHPCSLNRIWAQNSDDQWHLLWYRGNAEYNRVFRQFLLFLQPYKFKTKTLRLEFDNSILSSGCTKLDGILLIGTSELILPKSKAFKQDLPNLMENIRRSSRYGWIPVDDPNLKPDNVFVYEDIYYLQKKFHKYCITSKRNTKSFHKYELGYKQVSQSPKQEYNRCFLPKDESKCEMFKEDIQFSLDEFKELSHSNFSMLPNEIILKIFQKLDLNSLSCISRVNKRFNDLSWDPHLYENLNIRDTHFTYWNSDLNSKFRYFAPRCKYLSQLDLSFCTFLTSEFIVFLNTCGRHLKHIKLNSCRSINDLAVCEISKICKSLKALDLNCCQNVTAEGISYLERLEFLEHLHIQQIGCRDTFTYTLCNVLQKNRYMRDLNIKGTFVNTDAVAIKLKTSCPNLERINLKSPCSCHYVVTQQGIDALAECKNLQELNIEGIIHKTDWNSDSFYRLLSSCQRLENINLKYCYAFTDRDLRALTLCRNLKYLNLSGIDSVTPDICDEILLKCSKLEKIILRYCSNINMNLVDEWNEKYQHVSIIYL